MKIFIYVTSQPKDIVTNLINRLNDAGVAFFIDKHLPTREWYKSNLEGNCRVFNNVFEYYDANYPIPFIPFILCAAEHDEDPDWEEIKASLVGDSMEIKTAPIQKQGVKRRAEEYVDEDTGQVIERIDPGKKLKDTEHYDLDIFLDEDHDTIFYQMTRPGETYCWTSVTTKFSERGHLPFFSSYFYLQSFGKPNDLDFLTHCWYRWDMPGEMVIEDLVKNHIEAGTKDESLVPRVHQNEILQLINLFNINHWP